MKVIKEGKKELIATMRVTCKKCKAELEIQAADLNKYRRDHQVSTYYYKCPCCGSITNYMRHKDLSEEIYNDIFDCLDYFD